MLVALVVFVIIAGERLEPVVYGLGGSLIGVVAFFGSSVLLKMQETYTVFNAISRRLKR